MKLLKMSFFDFISKYFAILNNAFNCLAAFLQHLLICSVKVSRFSMISPRTFTLLSELINTSSHNFRWVTSCWFGDNIINWNIFVFAFIPIVTKPLYGSFTDVLQITKNSLKTGSVKRQRIIISTIVQIATVAEMEQIIHETIEQDRS